MTAYQVAQLEEIEELDDGRCPYRPVRQHFGISTFGVTTWTAAAAGDRLLNEHDEQDETDELYLVLSGQARFELDGDSVPAPTGTFVSVPAGVLRTAFAEAPGTTILAMGGGQAGQPYHSSGWELWSPLQGLFQAGRHEELLERAAPLVADEHAPAALIYNVACSEALSGRSAAALEHLRRAVSLMPPLGDLAREDEDFRALRELPEFIEILPS